MLFLNKDPELAAAARRIVEEELQRETLSIVGWRDVPTNEGVLGKYHYPQQGNNSRQIAFYHANIL